MNNKDKHWTHLCLPKGEETLAIRVWVFMGPTARLPLVQQWTEDIIHINCNLFCWKWHSPLNRESGYLRYHLRDLLFGPAKLFCSKSVLIKEMIHLTDKMWSCWLNCFHLYDNCIFHYELVNVFFFFVKQIKLPA